jgi:hypothetical protein
MRAPWRAKSSARFVSSGLDATVLADQYAQRQRLTGGALQLLQGFMALGLLVGIAALGVISTRSVYRAAAAGRHVAGAGLSARHGRVELSD